MTSPASQKDRCLSTKAWCFWLMQWCGAELFKPFCTLWCKKCNDPAHWCIIQFNHFLETRLRPCLHGQVSTSNATLLFCLLHENCVPVPLNPHAFKNAFQNHGISQPPVCAGNPQLCKLAELCSECLGAWWHHGQITHYAFSQTTLCK